MSGPVNQLMPAEVRELVTSGRATAVDVREPYEWELPTGPLVIVCRSGSRSDHVAEVLAANGYDASNLAGGLQLWQQQGLPLEPAGGTVA